MAPSAFGYNEAQLRFHEGSAYTHLRDTSSAWQAQQRALELAPVNDYTDRTLIHLDRAICLARDGDGSEALKYASQALSDLTANQRQGIITLRAREILGAIPSKQLSLPAAREFPDLLTLPEETDGETEGNDE